MANEPIQAHYADELSHCYGCGRLNPEGLHIESHWDGKESVCTYTPRSEHIAVPGFVYGGLLASLIDCHGTGTAAAAMASHLGLPIDKAPLPRFVTGTLTVRFLHPTPLGVPLTVHGRPIAISGRKVTVAATIVAEGKLCVEGEVVALQLRGKDEESVSAVR
ncbi:MAG: thioesterase [Deltaproteobacteria bacterium RIFOXYA12_FULL_61_11]|nr:MAG: thioesterase [Deltaproteobacteria bacterium RIFOXYA12_FULL_61_11]